LFGYSKRLGYGGGSFMYCNLVISRVVVNSSEVTGLPVKTQLSLNKKSNLFRVHTRKGTLNPFDKQKRTDYGRRSSPLGSTPPKGTPLANLHMKKIQFTERVLALWGLYISTNKTQSHRNYTIIKQVPFEPHGIYSTKQTIKSH